MAGALALLVGGCFLAARVLRLGWLAGFFSRPVPIGYLHGSPSCSWCRSWASLGLDIEASETLKQLGDDPARAWRDSGITLAVGAGGLGT